MNNSFVTFELLDWWPINVVWLKLSKEIVRWCKNQLTQTSSWFCQNALAFILLQNSWSLKKIKDNCMVHYWTRQTDKWLPNAKIWSKNWVKQWLIVAIWSNFNLKKLTVKWFQKLPGFKLLMITTNIDCFLFVNEFNLILL